MPPLLQQVQRAGFWKVWSEWNKLRKKKGLEERSGAAMRTYIISRGRPTHKSLILDALQVVVQNP